MGNFKKFLRFEFGIGIWIDPKSNVYEFKDGITHEEWARTKKKKSTADLMKDGWSRVRVLDTEINFQTNNPQAVWDALDLLEKYPGRTLQFEFKGNKYRVTTQKQLLDLEPLLENMDFPQDLA